MKKKFSFKNTTLNIETNTKCTLQCPSCKRTDYKEYYGQNHPLPGRDLTVADLEKCLKYFNRIEFCGQHSDPIFSPYLPDMLNLCFTKNVDCSVHTAATGKSESWYKKSYEANKNAQWVFGIDGPPHLSHLYRKNQKGEQLFKMMCLAKESGLRVEWRYIIFKYNENYVNECREMADKLKIYINFIIPSRSLPEELLPVNPEYDWRKYAS